MQPGDVLVEMAHYPDGRRVSRLAAAVAEFGRGDAYHCSLVSGPDLVIEMFPPVGREHNIHERVALHPGTVHWLRVPNVAALDFDQNELKAWHAYDRVAAVAKARTYIGVKYGFDTIVNDLIASSWFRWISHMPAEDEAVDWLPVCSVMVLDCLQTGFGGWDLVRDLNTACAMPADVFRITILSDQGALVP